MKARSSRRAWWLATPFVFAAVLVAAPVGAADDGVTCGTTITVDTTLAHNLRCSADGLTVAADGVTLDLAGYTISGAGSGAGIKVTGSGVTVTNGVVKQFQQGVDVDRAVDAGHTPSQVALTRLTVKGNTTGLAVGLTTTTGPAQGTVSDSEFTGNSLDGIFLNGGGWTIEAATVAHNGRDGVRVADDVHGETVVGSRINDNLGDGIDFSNQVDGSKIADNVVSRNGGDGIHVDTSTTQITGNTTHANGGTGLWVNEDAGLAFGPAYLIADNTSTANLGFGIRACILVDTLHRCEAGMTDGGGNVARSNVQTPDCINVVCARRR